MDQIQHHQKLIDLAFAVVGTHLIVKGKKTEARVASKPLLELAEYLSRECPKPSRTFYLVVDERGDYDDTEYELFPLESDAKMCVLLKALEGEWAGWAHIKALMEDTTNPIDAVYDEFLKLPERPTEVSYTEISLSNGWGGTV